AGAEFGAVRRGATRLGRDQPRPCHAAIAHLVAANGECSDRTVDRRIADAAGRRQTLAEADDARERIDDAEAVADPARDEQPAIVGAGRGAGNCWWRPRAGHGWTGTDEPRPPRRLVGEGRGVTVPPTGSAAAAPDHGEGRGPGPPGPRHSSRSFPPRRSLA